MLKQKKFKFCYLWDFYNSRFCWALSQSERHGQNMLQIFILKIIFIVRKSEKYDYSIHTVRFGHFFDNLITKYSIQTAWNPKASMFY